MIPPSTCLSDDLILMNNLMVDISTLWRQEMYQQASEKAKFEGTPILEVISQFNAGYFSDDENVHVENFKTMMLVLTNDVVDFYDY